MRSSRRTAFRLAVARRSWHLGFPAVVFTYVKGTPMYGLKTESSFDAAHFLTDYHGKCENLHGHRWRVVAYLEQEELQTQGTHKDMVIDFADFKGALRDLTEAFDHSFVVEEGSLGSRYARVPRARGILAFGRSLPHDGGKLRPLFLREACGCGVPRVAGRRVRDPQQLRDLPWLAIGILWARRRRQQAR